MKTTKLISLSIRIKAKNKLKILQQNKLQSHLQIK